jgi:hypothetical protein
VGKQRGKGPLGRRKLDGKIILNWILDRYDRAVWTGFIWLKIDTSGGLL